MLEALGKTKEVGLPPRNEREQERRRLTDQIWARSMMILSNNDGARLLPANPKYIDIKILSKGELSNMNIKGVDFMIVCTKNNCSFKRDKHLKEEIPVFNNMDIFSYRDNNGGSIRLDSFKGKRQNAQNLSNNELQELFVTLKTSLTLRQASERNC